MCKPATAKAVCVLSLNNYIRIYSSIYLTIAFVSPFNILKYPPCIVAS